MRAEFEPLLCLSSAICYCYAGFPQFLASTFYSPAAWAIWKTLCMWNLCFSMTSMLAPKQAFSKCFALLHKELCKEQLVWICEHANSTENTKWEIIGGALWICMGRYYQQLNPPFIYDEHTYYQVLTKIQISVIDVKAWYWNSIINIAMVS